MTQPSYTPVTSIPCSTCAGPSVRVDTHPDGTYRAACEDHLDSPQQTGLWIGGTP